jgi:hypothetical protein
VKPPLILDEIDCLRATPTRTETESSPCTVANSLCGELDNCAESISSTLYCVQYSTLHIRPILRTTVFAWRAMNTVRIQYCYCRWSIEVCIRWEISEANQPGYSQYCTPVSDSTGTHRPYSVSKALLLGIHSKYLEALLMRVPQWNNLTPYYCITVVKETEPPPP